jgi:uncharacterized phage protein (TIGR02218 family)
MGLRRKYETTCSYELYDKSTCKAARKNQTYLGFAMLDSRTLWIPKGNATGGLLTTQSRLGVTAGYYAGGVVSWGGANFHISSHDVLSDIVQIRLYRHVPVDFAPPSSVSITPGCDHTLSTCNSVFSNAANFSGFPLIPDKNPFRDMNVPSGGKG